MDDEILIVNHELSIPLAELSFRFSRSSGPGGQHVQKSSTRVEVLFDVGGSPSLSDAQREMIQERLAGHLDSAGVLHLVAQSERSQLRNREEAIARLQTMLAAALKRRKVRRATRPTTASRERRLQAKRRRSMIKQTRRSMPDE